MTTNPDIDLFTPLQMGELSLPNRIAMAPLTRNRAGAGNVPQAINVTYYTQRAGAGLIITEGSQVSPQGVGYPATPGIHSTGQVAGWRTVTDAVHGRGGRIFLQLWHVGRISHPSLQPAGALPVAPSAIRPEGDAFTYEGPKPFVTPRALKRGELAGVVAQFREAAANAQAAGFDGVEVHAANGYLLDQFLRDGTNTRDDEYGGNIGNRARLLREVTEAVAGVCGPGRVVVRISPENGFNDIRDSDPQALYGYVAQMLGELGIACLHVVEGDMMTPDAPRRVDYRRLRQQFAGCYMANNGYTLERANTALRAGDADLVSFGKPYIANPDLAERLATGAPLNTPDPATFYGGGEQGYTDYPPLAEAGAGN